MSDLRLLAVLAHPDDESMGFGPLLATASVEGVACHVVTATRGERGRVGVERPGAAVAGPIREGELRRAAKVLGVAEVSFLDFLDGELDTVEPTLAIGRVADAIRRVRPHVVVTFPHDGAYGHPDHIAVSQWTGAAIVEAAAGPGTGGAPPHVVDKLYWLAWSEASERAYAEAFGDVVARVDGVVRQAVYWPEWAITTRIDAHAHWRTVWAAVRCHVSQLAGYGHLERATDELHQRIWGVQELYRVWSRVNGGRAIETDAFAGLRPERPRRGSRA